MLKRPCDRLIANPPENKEHRILPWPLAHKLNRYKVSLEEKTMSELMPVILALEKPKQEDFECEFSLGYRVRFISAKTYERRERQRGRGGGGGGGGEGEDNEEGRNPLIISCMSSYSAPRCFRFFLFCLLATWHPFFYSCP